MTQHAAQRRGVGEGGAPVRLRPLRAGVEYEAGDSLGIVCANTDEVVAEWLGRDGTGRRTVVEVDGEERSSRMPCGRSSTSRKITPDLLTFVAERNADPRLATLLRRENKSALAKYLWSMQARRPAARVPGRGRRRGMALGAQAAAAAAVLDLVEPQDEPARGAADGLGRALRRRRRRRRATGCARPSSRTAPRRARCRCTWQKSPHFRPPAIRATPMIMVGPRHRHRAVPRVPAGPPADGHTGRNWLFFGEQHEAQTSTTASELRRCRRRLPHPAGPGVLARSARADLRPGPDGRARRELWRWLQDGAHFYVCGDASAWPRTSTTPCCTSRGARQTRRGRGAGVSRSGSSRRSATSATCTD